MADNRLRLLPLEHLAGVDGGILRWSRKSENYIHQMLEAAFKHTETVDNGDGTYTHTYTSSAGLPCQQCEQNARDCRC